jgi:cytochrome c oxidase cbb3-type subunit 3
MSSRCPETLQKRRSSVPEPQSIALVLLLCGAALLSGCERERRSFAGQSGKVPTGSGLFVRNTALQPGHPQAPASGAAQSAPTTAYEYEGNAYAVSQGKRLFRWYNCSSCHAPGGGGDWGPPLSDAEWIYGAAPQQVFESIWQGRPAGMPSFAGHITEDQTWQLVAFVRSLSGQLRSDVASGRSDTMSGREAETARDREPPKPMKKPDGNVR